MISSLKEFLAHPKIYDEENLKNKNYEFLSRSGFSGSSEAFNKIKRTGLEDTPSDFENLSIELGIDLSQIIKKITTYLKNISSNTFLKSLELAQELENNLYKKLFQIEKKREILLKSIVISDNFQFIKNCINSEVKNPSYRNVQTRKLTKTFPSINTTIFLSILYEVFSIKKSWNITLPKWFLHGYIPLRKVISQTNKTIFTTKDIQDDFKKLNPPIKNSNIIYRALENAINLGIIKRIKKGYYQIIHKPVEMNDYKSKEEIKSSKIYELLQILNNSIYNFIAGYTELARAGFIDEKSKIGKSLKDFHDKNIKPNLELFNNNQKIFDAFYQMLENYQNITSAVVIPPKSYNNIIEKMDYTFEFMAEVGKSLILIQENPDAGLENYTKAYKNYMRKNREI